MSDLNAKALEAAKAAMRKLQKQDAPVHIVAEAAIRAYLTAIRYPQQRAVVEAAVRHIHVQNDYPRYTGWQAKAFDADAALRTAVAALEDRTDG